MKRLLAILSVGFATALLPAAPAPKEEAKLLIVSTRTGKAEFFLVNPDGTGAKNLTSNKSTNSYPAWSPDGKKLAFASDRDGVMIIYVMDAEGGNVKALTKGNEMSRVPSWSPDGKKLAFCRQRVNGTSIPDDVWRRGIMVLTQVRERKQKPLCCRPTELGFEL